ncbi:TPA: 5-formyltetrahydrofolate cyclo-ligase [Candidatus Bathyarchaeota archaeon]|nr:5-formyltetrahydrofolate cyclo-ligase [Candidatus Bathyarchaeota archaeon]
MLENRGVARFPKPIRGRIPNFIGAEKAAERMISQKEFENAEVIKVNPDSPQIPVRLIALKYGKLLMMPTPRLKKGFMLLDPYRIPRKDWVKASTIRGAFKYGKTCSLKDLPQVDLIVVGSVAVSKDGVRIGKGGGYSEIEYGILRELSLIDERTPIFSSIHDLQLIASAPKEDHDLVIDFVFTPRRALRIKRKYPQPKGILWEKLTDRQIREMPVLLELRKISMQA